MTTGQPESLESKKELMESPLSFKVLEMLDTGLPSSLLRQALNLSELLKSVVASIIQIESSLMI